MLKRSECEKMQKKKILIFFFFHFFFSSCDARNIGPYQSELRTITGLLISPLLLLIARS